MSTWPAGWPGNRAGVLAALWSFTPPFPVMLGFAGTPGYLSPEVLRKEAYGKPVDIWACGEAGVLGEMGCTHKHCTRPTPGCPQLGAPSPPRPELLTQPWLLPRSPPPHCLPCARQSSLEKGQQVPGWGMDTGGAGAVWTTLAGLPPCQGRLPRSQCSGGGLPCEVGSGGRGAVYAILQT